MLESGYFVFCRALSPRHLPFVSLSWPSPLLLFSHSLFQQFDKWSNNPVFKKNTSIAYPPYYIKPSDANTSDPKILAARHLMIGELICSCSACDCHSSADCQANHISRCNNCHDTHFSNVRFVNQTFLLFFPTFLVVLPSPPRD